MRWFREGGEGMWFLLASMGVAFALVVLVAIALVLLRPKPFWLAVVAFALATAGLGIVGIGIGFHALGMRQAERMAFGGTFTPEFGAQIRDRAEKELSALYLFAPIAASPAFFGALGIAAAAGWRAVPRTPA